MERITRFFLICSGADLRLLDQCPSDRTKYAGLGATVFFTGFFAFMAAAFALYTVFDSYWISVAVGLVWGLMIFNLDRYIVSGMRKEGNAWREFLHAFPRLVLAILISVVIAKPLELRIFDKEIQPELVLMEQRVFAVQENEIRKRFIALEETLKKEMSSIQQRLAEKTATRDELLKAAREEADGTGGSRRKNLGPIYKLKKADADRAEEELRRIQATSALEMNELQEQLRSNDSLRALAMSQLEYKKRDGLAARMEALDSLSKKSPPIQWAGWFLMLLIIAVECAPVFVKLISMKGPYDNLLKGEEFRFFVRETSEMAESSDTLRGKSQGMTTPEKQFINERLDAALRDN